MNNSLSLYAKCDIMEKQLNRIKVVLVENNRTNKWLAEQLGKDQATISKWCTNTAQPGIEMLFEIAKCLKVEARDLLMPMSKVIVQE